MLDRGRNVSRRWTALVAMLACTATAGAVIGATPSDADTAGRAAATAVPTAGPLDNHTVEVGPEERIFGPSGLTDFPFFSERTASGKLLGFISNNDSYSVTSKRNNAKLVRPRVILRRGRAGSFDKCGAWLIGSIHKRGSRWMALYHAEAAGRGDNNRCIYRDQSTVSSVGRAVSHDSGRTWQKTGQVLTQDSDMTGPKSEDLAMGRLVQYGEFLYFFYAASDSNTNTTRGLHVARSHVDDLGARGTWRKWHCYKPSVLADTQCDFGGTGNEGLGGNSNPMRNINPMARGIIPNSYLNRNVALHASGSSGHRLYVSNGIASNPPLDGSDPTSGTTAWTSAEPIYPPVSNSSDRLVDNWDRTTRTKQLYAYPSIVSVTGNSSTSGQVFYIYYVKLFPGGDFTDRYLMRRKVTITSGAGVNRVALTTYFRRSDGRRRTSTERPMESAFKAAGGEGFLAGESVSGYSQVFECKKRKDYLLRAVACGGRERPVRRVGWISPDPDPATEATVPIYRCFNRAKRNHFASDSRSCDGKGRREVRLGYGLPPA
ncbi:DUF4185 domain-containing protein [Nocardioides antri]|uniref:DUF4185 domain-containing protein n=1 Tax=Nocardioides antri TaxID=2607659 RepID=UPI00122C44EC|nr:DUF4185 domain-containing protein [Nocardioides antri]